MASGPSPGILRVSARKMRDAQALLIAQPRVVLLFSVAGLGLVTLAADAIGLRDLAETVGATALFSILVAFPTYLVTVAAGTGLAWHAGRERAGLPRRPVPPSVMLRGATSVVGTLVAWSLVAGAVNALAEVSTGIPVVDVAVAVAATFWQMVASSVIAYLVVFRVDLATAVGRGLAHTRAAWRERLVRGLVVDAVTVAALVVGGTGLVLSEELARDDDLTADVLGIGAALVVIAAIVWSSALRLALNVAGRVDELRRDGPTDAVSGGARPDGPAAR